MFVYGDNEQASSNDRGWRGRQGRAENASVFCQGQDNDDEMGNRAIQYNTSSKADMNIMMNNIDTDDMIIEDI